jgi:SAM-dependent methyltransferase
MAQRAREGYQGTGPGDITPDGCAVEHWLRLPVGDEPDVIAAAVPAGSSILELGCGVGRVTHPLLERGFTVTAVDESPGTLAHVRGARTVCGAVETLDLGDERFDVVLLASFLVNSGDAELRRGLLRTCRRYVAEDGQVVIQREGEGWFDELPRETRQPDGGVVRVVSAEPTDVPHTATVRMEYEYPDARWTQTFRNFQYTGDAFERALAEAGLTLDAVLTEDGTWVRARPV